MVQVTIGGGGELQGAEANIVQGLVINNHNLIGVLDQLVHGQSGVVGLHNSVGHLGGGENGESAHNTVGILLTDLRDQKGTHTRASATTKRV